MAIRIMSLFPFLEHLILPSIHGDSACPVPNEIPYPPMQEGRTDWGFHNLLEAHADLMIGANVWGEKRGRIFLMGKISRGAMRDPSHQKAENVLDQHVEATAPNQKWGADVTVFRTQEGPLFLAGVLDLFSRTLVG